MKPVVPPKDAVRRCVPAASDEVVNVAVPVPFSVAVPNAAPESLKVTDPEGMLLLAATVAVSVTGFPTIDGFAEDVRVVVVATGQLVAHPPPPAP